jgi:hypothetical protein
MATKKKRRPYQLIVVLDQDDKARLDQAAELQKLTMADTVRQAIREHLRRLRSQERKAG